VVPPTACPRSPVLAGSTTPDAHGPTPAAGSQTSACCLAQPVIKAKSQLYLLKPDLFKQANKQAKNSAGQPGESPSPVYTWSANTYSYRKFWTLP